MYIDVHVLVSRFDCTLACCLQKLRYFFSIFNLIAWILLGATVSFTLPGRGMIPCLVEWRAGWIAMFFAWINFIMYLRR